MKWKNPGFLEYEVKKSRVFFLGFLEYDLGKSRVFF
jgi:hypothetical protein